MYTSTGLCQLVKRISICMEKRKKNGERFVYFSQMKGICDCLKSAVWELRYPMCIICIRRGSNIAIAANVRTIT